MRSNLWRSIACRRRAGSTKPPKLASSMAASPFKGLQISRALLVAPAAHQSAIVANGCSCDLQTQPGVTARSQVHTGLPPPHEQSGILQGKGENGATWHPCGAALRACLSQRLNRILGVNVAHDDAHAVQALQLLDAAVDVVWLQQVVSCSFRQTGALLAKWDKAPTITTPPIRPDTSPPR